MASAGIHPYHQQWALAAAPPPPPAVVAAAPPPPPHHLVDSIVLIKRSSLSISRNLSSVHHSILSLSHSHHEESKPSDGSNGNGIYTVAYRVKYLVDTPENIWGCLDESMFLESADRYVRAHHVHSTLTTLHNSFLSPFPLLHHQWQIVDTFKSQISQRSRNLLFDHRLSHFPVSSFADALAALALIEDLSPRHVLSLFLHTRKAWFSHILNTNADDDVVSVLCQALRVIQLTVGQVGEPFLRVFNDMPLFNKVVLGCPPASTQLFGGIPNPDEEVKLWNSFRDNLESAMGILDKDYIAAASSSWLSHCGAQMLHQINGEREREGKR